MKKNRYLFLTVFTLSILIMLFSIHHNMAIPKPENKPVPHSEKGTSAFEKSVTSSASGVQDADAKPQKAKPKNSQPSSEKSSKGELPANPKADNPDKAKLPKTFLKFQDKYHLVAIPTYDGTYQLTHPKILYFGKGWNGYKYWMSMTPYPRGVDLYENPSIVVSNDGNTWTAPPGLKNPLIKPPKDSKAGGHYSDPHLVMNDDIMELWYRYNPAKSNKKKLRLPNNAINMYYRRRSVDGVNWTPPEKLLESKDGHLSLCVMYEDQLYKTWYATYGGNLLYSESSDAKKWSAPVLCDVPLPKGFQPYHQDIIHERSKYYLLQTAEKTANYTFQLFLLTSDDGIHFNNTQQIYPDKSTVSWDKISFYRSTLFTKDNRLNLYISLIIPHLNWFITKTSIPIPAE